VDREEEGVKYLPLLLLAGCYDENPAPALHGERHVTALGIPFWWVGPSDSYTTTEAASVAIDQAFTEWTPLEPETPMEYLLAVARGTEIQLYAGHTVPGDGKIYYAGFTWYGGPIEVAMDGESNDLLMGLYHQGMMILRHEWRHALRGDWH
jgi:hypothetical protein